MRLNGHSYNINWPGTTQKSDVDLGVPAPPTSRAPVPLNRSQYLSGIEKTVVRTRGGELPGGFNPRLVGELFRQ